MGTSEFTLVLSPGMPGLQGRVRDRFAHNPRLLPDNRPSNYEREQVRRGGSVNSRTRLMLHNELRMLGTTPPPVELTNTSCLDDPWIAGPAQILCGGDRGSSIASPHISKTNECERA